LQDDGNVYPEIPIAPRGREIEKIPFEGEELPSDFPREEPGILGSLRGAFRNFPQFKTR
jgi:hypothetical protein